MNLPKPKRRWYQFSLWTLLVVVTLLAVVLGVGLLCIGPAERQRASARKAADLREGVGGVGYEGRAKDESWLTRGLREWLPRDYFEKVIDLYLNESNVTDADLPHLRGFTNLEIPPCELFGACRLKSAWMRLFAPAVRVCSPWRLRPPGNLDRPAAAVVVRGG